MRSSLPFCTFCASSAACAVLCASNGLRFCCLGSTGVQISCFLSWCYLRGLFTRTSCHHAPMLHPYWREWSVSFQTSCFSRRRLWLGRQTQWRTPCLSWGWTSQSWLGLQTCSSIRRWMSYSLVFYPCTLHSCHSRSYIHQTGTRFVWGHASSAWRTELFWDASTCTADSYRSNQTWHRLADCIRWGGMRIAWIRVHASQHSGLDWICLSRSSGFGGWCDQDLPCRWRCDSQGTAIGSCNHIQQMRWSSCPWRCFCVGLGAIGMGSYRKKSSLGFDWFSSNAPSRRNYPISSVEAYFF